MMGAEELRRLEQASGKTRLRSRLNMTCPLLENGGCSVYEVRPLICRLFGLVDNPKMRCPHGCKPQWWLTDRDAHFFLAETKRISNGQLEGILPSRWALAWFGLKAAPHILKEKIRAVLFKR